MDPTSQATAGPFLDPAVQREIAALVQALTLRTVKSIETAGTEPILREIHAELANIKQELQKMTAQLDTLTREVAETKTVVDSAIELLNGLAQMIRDLKDDPAKLEALAADLDSHQRDLANAVAANTPGQPPTPSNQRGQR